VRAVTVKLGDTELVRVGLGTNRLSDSPEHVAFAREAVAAGINFVDTAHLYAGGESERVIGEALHPVPEGCVVATKGGYHPGDGRPDVLRGQIEESLRRLRTDTIALYYLHRVDPQTPLEQSLEVIASYRERGVIRHVGVSEVDVEQIERARQIVPIVAVQNRYNLADRKHEDVVDYCAAEGLLFVPYFPLRAASPPAVAAIAERHSATPAQIVLAWLLRRSPVMVPIPGTRSPAHVKENLAALDIELTDDEFDALR
jgi:aryl-alcohol dehydrogenase-like predicted oxidoreductase